MITPKQYLELVQQNPRPYDIVMLWNVPAGRCEHCIQVSSEFRQTAYSFAAHRNKPEKLNNKKIFFVELLFVQDAAVHNIYKNAGFKTVPYFTVSPMDLKRDSTKTEIFTTELKWLVGSNEVYDANKQIEFVNNALRTDVQIKFTFSSILVKNMIGFAIIGLLFQFVKYLYPFLMNQMVWFSIANTVFIICTGGLVFSMLNGMPLFRFERNQFGQVVVTEYFMRGQRGQYAGEGYIASTLFTVIGLAYLGLTRVSSWVGDKNKLRMWVMIILFVLFILQKGMLAIYRIKSSWYNPSFWPPDYYQRGPLSLDQGNNI